MPWSVVAAVVGAGIGAGASADASRKARNAQDKATLEANALSERQFKESMDFQRQQSEAAMQFQAEMADWEAARADAFEARQVQRANELRDTARKDNAGNIASGEVARKQLDYSMGFGGTGLGEAGALTKPFQFTQDDPSYQWRLSEGLRGVNNGAAAQGNLLSGAAQKALAKYAGAAASQEYGNAFARDSSTKSDAYNRLMGMVGMGQNATNSANGIAAGAAQTLSNSSTAAFNQASDASQNAANSIASILTSLGTNGANAMTNYGNSVNANNLAMANARAGSYLLQGQNWQNAGNKLSNDLSSWAQRNNNTYSNPATNYNYVNGSDWQSDNYTNGSNQQNNSFWNSNA